MLFHIAANLGLISARVSRNIFGVTHLLLAAFYASFTPRLRRHSDMGLDLGIAAPMHVAVSMR